MRKLIGPHLAGQWANKLDILRQWQPPLVVVLSPDVDKVRELRDACPDAIIVGRFYHDDSHYAENIRTRPEAFAQEIHQEIINNPVTPLLDYVQTNNEVCQDWEGIQQLNVFTERWMTLADLSLKQAYKCAILAFSVGNPDLPYKPGDPAGFDGRMLYWQQVLPSLNYAQRNDHLLLLHAYGYPDMFHPDADWYIYRYERQVQANLKTLGITSLKYAYGEIGIDRYIVQEKGGYKSVPTTDQGYVNQLLQWERDLQGQSQLLGGAIFTFGDSGGWDSYDITSTNVASMLAAHYVDHADEYEASGRGYQSPPVLGANNVQEKTYAPFVPNESPTVTAPDLPRDIGADFIRRVDSISYVKPTPGQQYYALVEAGYYPAPEGAQKYGPDHHILVDVVGLDGKRKMGETVTFFRLDHKIPKAIDKANEVYGVDNPMHQSGYAWGCWAGRVSDNSDSVWGMGLGKIGNLVQGDHVTYFLKFQEVIAPQAAQPELPKVEPPQEQPPVPVPADDRWQRSREFVRIWEGGYQDVPNDRGNWTGGEVGKGVNKGTKFGISAASYPDLDIQNLTMEQADAIYFRDYWQASGADKLPWPACLLVFDTAVLHGVGTARNWLLDVGPNAFGFASKRLHVYTRMTNWDTWGKGWVNRTADLLERAGQ